MRYLLHHSDATYDQTTKKWTFTLDRRISNPRSITIKKCVFTASTDDENDYPSVVYMRSDALHANAKIKHTVELKGSDHENSSDVLAVLEETHTLGRYAMKEKGVTLPVHGHTHLRSIDIYFTDGTTVLHGKLADLDPADDDSISDMGASVVLCWFDWDKLPTMLDENDLAIDGEIGDGIMTVQSRSPGSTSLVIKNTTEQMKWVALGETHGITALVSGAELEDETFPNVASSGTTKICMYVFQVPTVTTHDVVLWNNYFWFNYLDTSDGDVCVMYYWSTQSEIFTRFTPDFPNGSTWLVHHTSSTVNNQHHLVSKFTNLATNVTTTDTITDIVIYNQLNFDTQGEWMFGQATRHALYPSNSRPLNYSAIMGPMIVLDGPSEEQVQLAETWILAKYGTRQLEDSDKDATFFTELEVKASNR